MQSLTVTAAEEIWKMIEDFRGYSFCKAHSASYAQVSFESAYLQAHYTAEFMAAVISNGGGFYSTYAYVSECYRMKIHFAPIDINQSEYHYKGKEKTIRVGLMAIKGFSKKSADMILEERRKNGPYQSLYEYLHRVPIGLAENQLLNRLQAFRTISSHHTTQIYWQMKEFYENEPEYLQGSLFSPEELETPFLPPSSPLIIKKDELELLGYLLNDHPQTLWQPLIDQTNIAHLHSNQINHHIGKHITLVGFPITKKIARTKKDLLMGFYSFEDAYFLYDVTFFPQQYEKYRMYTSSLRPCFLHGLVESDFEVATLTLKWLKPIQGNPFD